MTRLSRSSSSARASALSPTRAASGLRWLSAALAVLTLAACTPRGSDGPVTGPGAEPPQRPVVVATTTMLGDLVGTLAGDAFEVVTIMEPGADPHLYRPTPSDARAVARSQLVVMNGLHLEGWADDLVANAGGTRPVVVVAEGVEAIRGEDFAGGVDPHIWFDVRLWSRAATAVADALVAVSPGATSEIRERASAYETTLNALHTWAADVVASVPEQQRVLVTSHDAFNYFGAAYGLQVRGIQGISTESEASQRDVANIVTLVRESGAPAVFTETSVNPTLIERVAAETGVRVAGPLYSDSLGAPGSGADTYVGMVEENVRLIVDPLGGAFRPFAP